jgi:hypothetical protein
MDIIDLDILKPTGRIIQIGGKKIEISFIPLAITFAVDEITKKLFAYQAAELQEDMKKAEEAFNLSVKLCALFCEHNYPDINEQWLRKNTTVGQIQVLVSEITKTLTESMQGLERYAKNAAGAKTKT